MDTTEKVVEVLSEAEDKLAAVLRQAVEGRAYEEVAAVAAISNRLADLIDEVQGHRPLPSADSQDGSSKPRNKPPSKKRQGKEPFSKGRHRQPGGYPRFARDGDRLVKIGWSKKEGMEYEHRAPRTAVRGVASTLRSTGEREFSMDDLLPITDQDGEEIPSYQAYLVLAWFRSWGAVQKASRGGYLCHGERLVAGEVDAAWDGMSSRIPEEDPV